MKERAKGREYCEVYLDWLDYEKFHAWAWANGYKEGLTLCRTGDIGNYEPSNVRWDTQASNTIEAQSKTYKFMLGDIEIKICNLAKYCKSHGLNASHMSRVHSGKLTQHKGYTKEN